MYDVYYVWGQGIWGAVKLVDKTLKYFTNFEFFKAYQVVLGSILYNAESFQAQTSGWFQSGSMYSNLAVLYGVYPYIFPDIQYCYTEVDGLTGTFIYTQTTFFIDIVLKAWAREGPGSSTINFQHVRISLKLYSLF